MQIGINLSISGTIVLTPPPAVEEPEGPTNLFPYPTLVGSTWTFVGTGWSFDGDTLSCNGPLASSEAILDNGTAALIAALTPGASYVVTVSGGATSGDAEPRVRLRGATNPMTANTNGWTATVVAGSSETEAFALRDHRQFGVGGNLVAAMTDISIVPA